MNREDRGTAQRSFGGEATEAAFLLGGIGTGNVSLGSRGELRDWEIFNRPNKGYRLPNTFFSIWAQEEGKTPVAKVLESRLHAPHGISHGYNPNMNAGLPRLDKSTLYGEYPVVHIDFEDRDLPVQVSLKAFTPLIPLNPEDSGIPVAILTYQVANPTRHKVDFTIAGSLINPVGGVSYDLLYNIDARNCGQNVNEFRSEEGLSGLYLYSQKYDTGNLKFGNMTLATTHPNTTYKRCWIRGEWYDYLQEYWDDFSSNGRLTDLGYETASEEGKTDTGSLGVYATLQPGEKTEIVFFLSWYFPNRINGWSESAMVKEPGKEITQNYYANVFNSSWSVAMYVMENFERLSEQTAKFRAVLFASTLPPYVMDAISSNITVLRSNTCFWLKDGNFYGYEGCYDQHGCCDGTCTHVWNYAQTLAFLFPMLEQTMRNTEFLIGMDEEGKLEYRAYEVFAPSMRRATAAADGQMGVIMRVYREWKLTGDRSFLQNLWPAVKKALRFSVIHWDLDGDLVFDGRQHNTYDIKFYGPNPLTAVFFLGALRAMEEMAAYLDEADSASMYRDMFERSSRQVEQILWNGSYYVQRLADVDEYKYQHGIGCLSDQLLAQQLAHLYGLGYLLDRDRVKSAIHSVYKHNFRTDFTNHVNCQRTYVLYDEQGLLICSWPTGERPKLPFVYSDEVWTGIEYQVATHLICEGFIEEGLHIVRSVRERHDGFKRNPWNEVECGHHYARSMASWGLLIALSGFEFDMPRGTMKFAPAMNHEFFQTFWSTGRAWGTYTQRKNEQTGHYDVNIEVIYGNADGIKVEACGKTIVIGEAAV